MELVVASDIFGRTPELDTLVSELSSSYAKFTIVDPYKGQYLQFKNENEAYVYFQHHCGLHRYKDHLSKVIQQRHSPLCMIGFSVGASVVWALSGEMNFMDNSKAFCFYGSQIRFMVDVEPKVEMTLIFPKYEIHFDVAQLSSQICGKKRVRCFQEVSLHGFMNKRSDNFDEKGYQKYLRLLRPDNLHIY